MASTAGLAETGRQLAAQGPGGALFIRVAILCSAVAFLDGFDSTSISVAAPPISQQLGILQAQLGLVFSSALLGATIGAFSFGRLADHFGRKRMLLVATLVFALFTLATASASSLYGLLAIRFLAGIGLGGATPCFIALATEFAPDAHRARVTGFIWTAFALGTVIGTFISAFLLSVSGWQAIFLVGGIAPLVVLFALAVWLPESAQFLRVKNGQAPAATIAKHGPDMRGLLKDDARQTLLLWFAFWTAFGTMVAVFSFAPTIMRDHGIPIARAAVALGLSGVGSLIGTAIAGLLIERFGSATVLATAFCCGGVATAMLGYAPESLAMTAVVMGFIGMLVAGICGAGLLAFAAMIYPTAMRSTGVGAAMGSGRFGQVSMPLVISAMLAGGFGYREIFIVLGAILALGAVAMLVLLRLRLAASAGLATTLAPISLSMTPPMRQD